MLSKEEQLGEFVAEAAELATRVLESGLNWPTVVGRADRELIARGVDINANWEGPPVHLEVLPD